MSFLAGCHSNQQYQSTEGTTTTTSTTATAIATTTTPTTTTTTAYYHTLLIASTIKPVQYCSRALYLANFVTLAILRK